LTGFPWEPLGAALIPALSLIQAADLFGAGGLTFIVVLINMALAGAWFRRLEKGRQGPWMPLALALGLAAALFGYGQARLHQMERRMAEAPSRSIAVVQGSIEQKVKWDPDQRVFTLQTYRDLSTRAAAQNPWLVVWPETAMPFYYVRDEGTTQWLDQWVRQTGRPVLFGAPAFEYHGLDKRHYNRAYLLGPGAERLGYYDKVHLVPYGEYVPLQKFMPFIKKLTQASGTFFPGEEGKVLTLDGQGLGVLICYESIFPVLARKAVNQGAQYLVVITNDAWFGRSSAPRQHYDHAVLRAVEHRRSVIRAANTGISGLIRPDGRTVTDLGLFERDFIIGSLPGLSGRTLYTAAGDVIPWASLGATLVLFAATLIRRRHAGRS
jgi:apolipoprotein N-acyltransferase